MNLPNFTFDFQGVKVYIFANNYTVNCVAQFGQLQGSGGILLGDTFLRNYVVTYDKQNSQMSFLG